MPSPLDDAIDAAKVKQEEDARTQEAQAELAANAEREQQEIESEFAKVKADFLSRMAGLGDASLRGITVEETKRRRKGLFGREEWRTEMVTKTVWEGPPGVYRDSSGYLSTQRHHRFAISPTGELWHGYVTEGTMRDREVWRLEVPPRNADTLRAWIESLAWIVADCHR